MRKRLDRAECKTEQQRPGGLTDFWTDATDNIMYTDY